MPQKNIKVPSPAKLPRRTRHYLKEWRKRLGLTQAQLADACGYHAHSTVNKAERGLSSLSARAIDVYTEIFRRLAPGEFLSAADLFRDPYDADAGRTGKRAQGLLEPTKTSAPIPVRLDDEVRAMLGTEARYRHIGLSTLLRQLASEAAERLRRERIREQSKTVGEYVTRSPEAAEFYEEWGTPKREGA